VEQDAMNAMDEFGTTVPCTEGESFGATFEPAFCEAGEAGGVGAGCISNADDAFIAGHFALAAETMFDPRESRVEREEDEAELLKEIGPVVATVKVLGFVEDDLLEFGGCKP
jgi:hypothetical protein